VSVDALAAPREPLLRQLARDAEFALASDGSEWPPLTLRIDAIPLELALPRLVGDLGYDAEWQTRNGGHRLVKLTVGTDRPRAQPGGPDEVDAAAADVSATLERALEAQSAMPPSPEERAAQAALVTDPDPEQRIRAALALEPEGEGLKQLLDMLANDPDPRVRAATTASIENSEEFAAVRALVDALHDPNPEVVVEVIDSLEFAADASIVPDLEPLLGHEDPRVRQRAAEAIDFYGN
jgi:HEAT repeat protein